MAADLVVLTLLLRISFTPTVHLTSFRLVLVAMAVTMVGDVVSGSPALAGPVTLRAVHAIYALAFATRRSGRPPPVDARHPDRGTSRLRPVVPPQRRHPLGRARVPLRRNSPQRVRRARVRPEALPRVRLRSRRRRALEGHSVASPARSAARGGGGGRAEVPHGLRLGRHRDLHRHERDADRDERGVPAHARLHRRRDERDALHAGHASRRRGHRHGYRRRGRRRNPAELHRREALRHDGTARSCG